MDVDWLHQDQLLLALAILLKLGLGALLGGLIGFERELHGRPAGIRTHMLLVMAVVLFCEVSRHFGTGDPARIAAQIVTGIGFLGAGTILRMGAEVRGLTSAASVWAASAIGMGIGAGGFLIVVSVCATVMTLLTLSVVDRIERKITSLHRSIEIVIELDKRETLIPLMQTLVSHRLVISSIKVVDEPGGVGVRLLVTGKADEAIPLISAIAGVRFARLSF